MLGDHWRTSVFDFYSLEGAQALAKALAEFGGGRIRRTHTDLPIKCPVAPLEFTFLADDYFRRRGIRDDVEMVYVTLCRVPSPNRSPPGGSAACCRTGACGWRPTSSSNPSTGRPGTDLLRRTRDTVRPAGHDPPEQGAEFIARSGLGDELNYVPVDKHTLRSTAHPNIFAVGDASNIPASKAGSVAHFSVEIFCENFLDLIAGKPMRGSFERSRQLFHRVGQRKGC